MQKFLKGRIDLVKSLLNSSLDFHYADCVLILCGVLSACASIRWPGKEKIDRRRFIELLINHSSPDFHTSWISVPSLLNGGLICKDQTLYGKPGNDTRIYCDNEIDISLEDAKKKYPDVLPNKIRQNCYAFLIYERLRCGYSHEYCPGESITHIPPSKRDARISYIGRLTNGKIKRMIGFHLDYLISLSEYHVSILPNTCSSRPSCWWIDKYKTNKS